MHSYPKQDTLKETIVNYLQQLKRCKLYAIWLNNHTERIANFFKFFPCNVEKVCNAWFNTGDPPENPSKSKPNWPLSIEQEDKPLFKTQMKPEQQETSSYGKGLHFFIF